MTETTHTPGPWEITETGTWPETNHHLAIVGQHHPTGRIALVEGFDILSANAHLIAAAPDLYATLEKAEQLIHSEYCSQTHHPVCLEIEAVLLKARGGDPR